MPDLIIPVILFVDGLVCIVLALSANAIGLDPTATWGKTRFTLLLLGIILGSILPLRGALRNRKPGAFALFRPEPVKTWFVLGHVWVMILMIYAWFITYGNFTTWDHTTHYYTQLADAFGKGQLHIDREPDRALVEAPDPYDHTSRPAFDDEIWDFSLYKGKLYLYWGPVPALLIMPIQMISARPVTDNYLVFLFFAGILIVNSLIILKLRRSFFPAVPAWSAFACIALIGLILPISWSLNIPNVYEAAIGAGQFFLIGGIYFVLRSTDLGPAPNRTSLCLAGIFWACAVGSRAINVLSVVFLAAFTSFWIARQSRPIHWRQYVQALSALYMPLLVGAVLTGWYNWARFDSPFEFGLRYQITIFNLNKDIGLTFRPEYLPLNLFIYILQPFEFASKFPFIQPTTTSVLLDQFGIYSPLLYTPGRLTGLLLGAPFLTLGIVNLFSKKESKQEMSASRLSFFAALLGGSFLINFLAILLYYFGQIRFLVDVVSQVTLLAIIGYWKILSFGEFKSRLRFKLFASMANLLIAFTICAGMLLALTSETSRMEKLNPALFDKMNSALSGSE